MTRTRLFGFLSALILIGGTASADVAEIDDDPLPRKPWLGAAIGPADGGVAILEVLPDSSAASAGLEPGDLIVAVDEHAPEDPTELIGMIAEREAGDRMAVKVEREGQTLDLAVTLIARPEESGDGYAVEYSFVRSDEHRLRTIVTKPRDDAKHPGVLLIQGLTGASIDNPTGPLSAYRELCATLTRAGYVTMRMDKPGSGDSEGGPFSEVDFATEVEAFRQALIALKERPDVDPDRVFIVGHSMGGIEAPILAAEVPVRGVVVYGTVVRPWFEYLLENSRRQLAMSGESYAEIDRYNRRQAAFLHHLAQEGSTPSGIAEAHPELASYIGGHFADGSHEYGRTYRFFQQIMAENLAESWEAVDADILAVWGTSDFVSDGSDHRAIAEIVNRDGGDRATYVALEDIDHGFVRAEGREASMRAEGSGEPDPAFANLVRDWIAQEIGEGGPDRRTPG